MWRLAGRTRMARKWLVMAAAGGPGALPPGHRADLAGAGDGELAQAHRRAWVGRLRGLAQPAVGPGLRNGLSRLREGAALDCDHILPAGRSQPVPEQGVVAIADVRDHHRAGAAASSDLLQGAPSAWPGHLLDHLQRQPPLLRMTNLAGDSRPLTAPRRAGRGNRIIQRPVVPAFRAEQPPVRRARGTLVHQVHAHPTWQLPILPSVPEYCRATHGDAFPSFGKPVSSTTSASTGSLAANHRATFRRTPA